MKSSGGDLRLFWIVGGTVVVLDLITKILAVRTLSRIPRPILGDWFTLQLVYNPGAAFGINAGQHSRWVFLGLALIALVVLGTMVRHTKASDFVRLTALGLVCGGAVGNLIDRVRNARGVIDFLDVGIGQHRWPTFNVADMAVTVGAFTLAVVLWREGREAEKGRQAEPSSAAEASP